LGSEFTPTLQEGTLVLRLTMAPSISLEKATSTIMKMERRIKEFPAVKEVMSRIGRPEAGSHPHPVNYAEIYIELNPRDTWGSLGSKGELIEGLEHELSAFPGIQLNFTQPIQNAFDELLTGIKAQLALKVFGEDLTVLRTKAQEIYNAIDLVPGLVDLSVEQSFGQPQLQIIADRDACSRYGVNVNKILELVESALGGEVIDYILTSVGYTYNNTIESSDLLDPSCGSGGFLVRATRRLVSRFQIKFGKTDKKELKNPKNWRTIIGKLTPDEAKIILESIQGHIYGLDINPFACHINHFHNFSVSFVKNAVCTADKLALSIYLS